MKTLFVLGDSISIQYGPYLKKMVQHRFLYDRKRGEKEALADLDHPVGANGGDSDMVLQYMSDLRNKGTRYDFLLVNCGLHDIKTDPSTGAKQVPIERYRSNLEQLVGVAREVASFFIWVRTTDVVDDIHNTRISQFHRFHEDVLAYNQVADQVMTSNGVPTIDLYTFTREFGAGAYCDHVHFTEEVRRLQAAYIAGFLESQASDRQQAK